MAFGTHHYYKKAPSKKKNTNKVARFLDYLIYFAAPFSVLVFVPQLLKIWQEKNISGVSLLSWVGLLGNDIFWLIYGIVHKQKPIIFINIIGAIVAALIVFGILKYQ